MPPVRDRLRPGYPQWLLDHPLVLKVFGHHVPFEKHHPKLRVIPLGVDNPTKAPALIHKVRMRVCTVALLLSNPPQTAGNLHNPL